MPDSRAGSVKTRTPFTQVVTTKISTLALIGLLATSGVAGATETGHIKVTEINTATHPFTTLLCARQPLQVRFFGNLAEVIVNNESRLLVQALSASGARYVAPNDETTELWGKGPFATVTWSGQTLPLCAPAGAIIPPFRASGNEPFWAITYNGWQATLARPGLPDETRDAQISETTAHGQTLQAGQGPNAWEIRASDAICTDSMTGMPHPQTVTFKQSAQTHTGCGGDPERLLQGTTWRITHINDSPISTASSAEIIFLPNNQLAGNSGCNRFFGNYTLTGESLTVKGMGSTRMACAPSDMAIEDVLLQQLSKLERFSLDTPDTLTLHTAVGTVRAQATQQ